MALQFLRQHGSDLSNGAIAKRTDVDRRTVGRLRDAFISGDDACLEKLLNPADNRAGRRFTLTEVERKMVIERIVYAARRGFAMTADTLRDVMGRIAADGQRRFEGNRPSMETMRRFRSAHRCITFRKVENKDYSKLKAENPEHAITYVRALENVQQNVPNVFSDGNFVWNMDETCIDGSKGVYEKVFGPSDTNRGRI